MIVSHKYKFIFIKTGKCGSTSIEHYLKEYCGPRDMITPTIESKAYARNYRGLVLWRVYLSSVFELLGFLCRGRLGAFKQAFRSLQQLGTELDPHAPASLVKKVVGNKIWHRYYKFCVERNPYDRMISLYFWRTNASNLNGFDQFIKQPFIYRASNFPFYSDGKTCMMDKVLRYENLDEELGQVLQSLGIPWRGRLDIRLKAQFRKDHRPYRAIYTKEQAAIVARLCANEIALMNYRF